MSEQINRTAQHRIGAISMHEVKVRKLRDLYLYIRFNRVYNRKIHFLLWVMVKKSRKALQL